ncbi:MAG: hypothetical protein ABJ057_03360 [Erythrobacter sp.]
MRKLLTLLRHPVYIGAVFRRAWSIFKDDRQAELLAIRDIQTEVKKIGTPPAFLLQMRAYEAELLLRTGEPAQSRALFLEVHKECKDQDDQLAKHLIYYTHYWLSMLDNKFSQADYWAYRARQMGLSGKGSTRLPSPPVPKDEFDKEFERIEAEIAKELAQK